MRLIHASLLVGAAVLGLGALALPAASADSAVHEMTIQLPGGGSETIRYNGNVAPKVTFATEPFATAWPGPFAFGFAPSYAALDQVAADMDRQMETFWRQAETMTNWPSKNGVTQPALPDLMPGGSSYSVISESVGGNVCTRMTEVTSSPNAGKPKIITKTSGNCDPSSAGAAAIAAPSGVPTIANHRAIPAASVVRTSL